jgi:hypothetical protein
LLRSSLHFPSSLLPASRRSIYHSRKKTQVLTGTHISLLSYRVMTRDLDLI